jgi:NitT/TauT family transport system permease protein
MARLPLGILPFVVGMIAWYFLGRSESPTLDHVVPDLGETFDAIVRDVESGVMAEHGWVTLKEILLGFLFAVVAAVVLAVVLDRWDLLRRTWYPSIVFFQALPKVAIAPLLVTWFGFGLSSKVATAALIAFFPILVAALTGLASTRSDEVDLMRSLGASNWQLLRMVRVPRALPSFFGGLEVGFVMAIVGAIVGELVGAQAGLGYLILFRSTQLDLPGMFSALIALSLLGVFADLAFKRLSRRMVSWAGQ